MYRVRLTKGKYHRIIRMKGKVTPAEKRTMRHSVNATWGKGTHIKYLRMKRPRRRSGLMGFNF